ncbi:PUA-like domain-containing protein [Bisporella sp. PMI_857]|nr:PUA-like domain-containing protein [Bisporella sp. PMI_857]
MSSVPLGSALQLRPLVPKSSSSSTSTTPLFEVLDPSKDARKIVRLVQCPQCSIPLREPVTMPCGNTICKQCIPELHLRTNISYPMTPNRLQGFTCPLSSCRKEHAKGDCSVDVVLNKIMEVVRNEVDLYKDSAAAAHEMMQVEEQDKWSIAGVTSLNDSRWAQVLSGGRLAATYRMAEMGELAYELEVIFTSVSPPHEQSEALDTALLAGLKETARSELDCNVCYSLFLDPFTTSCGHTLCRTCLHRVQDHSNLCPVCRRSLAIAPGVSASQAPSNAVLSKLIGGLYPEALATRIEAENAETNSLGELETPLFICTLSFPLQPTFLHIFEPRYRLMIRRVFESDRKFGMILSNRNRAPQGELGAVPFYRYGTMLLIVNMHVMPDGRSIIETVGLSRFRVLRYGSLDGYMVGKVERVYDMSVAEEEAIEAAETSSVTSNFSAEYHFGASPHHSHSDQSLPQVSDLDSLSTQELFDINTAFVQRMRDSSAPWLRNNIVESYGQCPEDPATFPWWFASIVPTKDSEKVKLLETTSVRERLKMCVVWAAELENQTKCVLNYLSFSYPSFS